MLSGSLGCRLFVTLPDRPVNSSGGGNRGGVGACLRSGRSFQMRSCVGGLTVDSGGGSPLDDLLNKKVAGSGHLEKGFEATLLGGE